MKTFTNKQIEVINETCGNERNFLLHYANFSALQEEPSEREYRFEEYNSDGKITGIITDVKLENDILNVEVIIEGCYRNLKIDEFFTNEFLCVQDDMLQDDSCEYTKEQIEDFGFMKNKSYSFIVESNIITDIKVLPDKFFEEHSNVFEYLMQMA